MVIPFQMVMFTLSGTADTLGLILHGDSFIVYLGVLVPDLPYLCSAAFVKSIPVEIEEAAMIDGCILSVLFFSVSFQL